MYNVEDRRADKLKIGDILNRGKYTCKVLKITSLESGNLKISVQPTGTTVPIALFATKTAMVSVIVN